MKTRVPATAIKVGNTIDLIGGITLDVEWVKKGEDGGVSIAGTRSNGEPHTSSVTAGAVVTRIDPDPIERVKVELHRERIVGRGTSFAPNTTPKHRLDRLRYSAMEDNEGPFSEPWVFDSIEHVVTRPDPKYPHMVQTLAKVREFMTVEV